MRRLSRLASARLFLAILAGLCLAASFPKLNVAGLAWVAPGLFIAAAFGTRGWECFRWGYVAALVHYLTSIYWILLIPYRWHGIPFGPATGWLALCGTLALFPAAWVWLVLSSQHPRRTLESGPITPQELPPQTKASFLESLQAAVRSQPSFGWAGRTLWAMGGAAAWVAMEMLLARVLGGFPWTLLGVTQHGMLPLIQIASITGVYGVSFLMVWFSLSFVSAGVMLLRRPSARSIWLGEIFLPILVVAVAFNLGFRHIRNSPTFSRTLRVTLIQPSIPQTLIWDEGKDDERFDDLLKLSKQALSNETDLLVWPEAAVPKLLRYDTNTFNAVSNLTKEHHVWMIVGADDAERRDDVPGPEGVEYFNSSFLISPEGELQERYIKRSLVMFGEYVPLQRWLPFLKWFTPVEGGFTPGDRSVPFKLKSLGVKTSVLICFEDIFPQIGRGDVEPDTDFLVNITNDGWFGESAAQWQQAATALFRAVENGVPLIRCTNNGLTCWIDAQGQIREIFRDSTGTVYGPGFLNIQIPIPASGETHTRTFYNRHGDWFGWGCMGVTVLMLLRTVLARRRGAQSAETL